VYIVPLLLAVVAAGDGTTQDDSAALALPSVAAPATLAAHAASLTTEAAVTEAAQRGDGSADEERLSFDFRYSPNFWGNWRAVLADRLDLDWYGAFDTGQEINTFKEAYLTLQLRKDLLMDAGRVNVHQGVAFGYNPTDFFRAGSLRTIDSLDPDSLRNDRLGTVMVRGQYYWDTGAVTALYAPQVRAQANSAPFSPDWGATNSRQRWMLALTQRLGGDLSPQWLLYGQEGHSLQLGMNVTHALGPAIVAYLEVLGGKERSLWAQALSLPAATSFRSQAATGLTYAVSSKLSLAVEFEYDGASLSRTGWLAAQQGNSFAYQRYRDFVSVEQELASQQNLLASLSCSDCVIRHLDLATFARTDLFDRSFLPWVELRYHWSHVDAALRWQSNIGTMTSDFGESQSGQTWQMLFDYYL
jgi:hypothetical protein